ncbi:MAG TPA: hypothetical protein VL916_11485 [Ilumatobacteraceae bacterium]|nr:hypothetical protein [Ilumatobacteraceae bacterium]
MSDWSPPPTPSDPNRGWEPPTQPLPSTEPPAGGLPAGGPAAGGPPPLPPLPTEMYVDPTPPDRPIWKKPWFILVGLAAIAAIVGAIVFMGGDDDDGEVTNATTDETLETTVTESTEPSTDTTPVDTADTTPVDTTGETTAPTAPPPGDDDLALGDIAEVENGAVVRVNSVEPNAPPVDEFFQPEPGFTFTRVDVEMCAGTESLYASPIYFMAFLDDNSEAQLSFLGMDLPAAGLAPGGCARGLIDFNVPDGHTVADIVFLNEIFEEAARWSTASSNDIDGPLSSGVEVESSPLGETLTVESGETVVAKSITPIEPEDDFSDPGPGRQLYEIDVEVCAGSEPVSVNPYSWVIVGEDNRLGGPSFSSGTLPSIDVAAGECVAGTVHLDIAETSTIAYIVYGDVLLEELARWEV